MVVGSQLPLSSELGSARPQGRFLSSSARLANSNFAGLNLLHGKTLLKMNFFDTGGRILYLINPVNVLLVPVIGLDPLKGNSFVFRTDFTQIGPKF